MCKTTRSESDIITVQQQGQECHHDHAHEHTHEHDHSHSHEKRTRWVVYLTIVTMVLEIVFGHLTNSMALLADGYHMAAHVLVLGLTWAVYFFSRRLSQTDKMSFDKKKLLSLSGFTSAIILLITAVFMVYESAERLLHPLSIKFDEAIFIAIIGLAVNALSAIFLHHNHQHHDHNIRSAYLHVLADALTSVAAIFALVIGYYYGWYSLDGISCIISSAVIIKWAISLMKHAGKDLIDFKMMLPSQPTIE